MGWNRNNQNLAKNGERERLLASLDRIPEMRDARIQEIKSAIDTGLYKTNALGIADRILEEMRFRCYRI